ncbi:MAG: hypothetical protein QOK11_1319 [Pseudonocardiales bacterium]|nr:hypothetical protein [Pseudonocardiales bacterium]
MHMKGPGACWDRAYKQALTTPAWRQAGWLLDTIGPRFTAAGVGGTDAPTLRRWRDDHTEPRDHSEQARLQLLFRLAYAITLVYGTGSVATSFLRSANPQLDDQAPWCCCPNPTPTTCNAPRSRQPAPSSKPARVPHHAHRPLSEAGAWRVHPYPAALPRMSYDGPGPNRYDDPPGSTSSATPQTTSPAPCWKPWPGSGPTPTPKHSSPPSTTSSPPGSTTPTPRSASPTGCPVNASAVSSSPPRRRHHTRRNDRRTPHPRAPRPPPRRPTRRPHPRNHASGGVALDRADHTHNGWREIRRPARSRERVRPVIDSRLWPP